MEFVKRIGGYDVRRDGIIGEIEQRDKVRFYPLELVGGFTIEELQKIIDVMKMG